MILSLTYNKMPPPLLFRSSLWGTEKPFIKNWIDGKVLSNLVSDNTKISTYCATETSRIQTEHHKHFFFLTSYSFTKVWIPQSYFYLIIRFLSPYQNSYFTKLQVTLNFSDKLHILNTNNIVKSPTLILNNLKIWYKDTIQVCFTSL